MKHKKYTNVTYSSSIAHYKDTLTITLSVRQCGCKHTLVYVSMKK